MAVPNDVEKSIAAILAEHYGDICDRYEPWLVSSSDAIHHQEVKWQTISVKKENRYNPLRTTDDQFLQFLYQLDELTDGPPAMNTPRELFTRLSLLPGLVFGFGERPLNLEPWLRRALKVPPNYRGLVPLSMLALAPTPVPGEWGIYSLSSLNNIFQGATPEGILKLTLVAGSALVRAETMTANLQWHSTVLRYTLPAMGRIRVVKAWQPAHDIPASAIVRFSVTDGDRLRALRNLALPNAPQDHLRPTKENLERLQRKIDSGYSVELIGRAVTRGTSVDFPVEVFDPQIAVSSEESPDDQVAQ